MKGQCSILYTNSQGIITKQQVKKYKERDDWAQKHFDIFKTLITKRVILW